MKTYPKHFSICVYTSYEYIYNKQYCLHLSSLEISSGLFLLAVPSNIMNWAL